MAPISKHGGMRCRSYFICAAAHNQTLRWVDAWHSLSKRVNPKRCVLTGPDAFDRRNRVSRVRRAARCVICCWGVVLLASVVSSGIGAEGQAPLSEEAVVAELGADGVQRATIILDSYSYSPNHLVVQA